MYTYMYVLWCIMRKQRNVIAASAAAAVADYDYDDGVDYMQISEINDDDYDPDVYVDGREP